MEKEQKKKNIALVVIVIETILLAAAGIYIIFNSNNLASHPNNTNEPNIPIEDVKENIQPEDSTKEVLAKLVGEWGMCIKEYDCRGVVISKTENSEYKYTPYIMWSDGGETGTIKSVEKQGDKYKLTVYFSGYNNELGSSPEQTNEYLIDMTNIEENNINIGDNTYQKMTGDRETFFKSLF